MRRSGVHLWDNVFWTSQFSGKHAQEGFFGLWCCNY
jgi:hypothetical protein